MNIAGSATLTVGSLALRFISRFEPTYELVRLDAAFLPVFNGLGRFVVLTRHVRKNLSQTAVYEIP